MKKLLLNLTFCLIASFIVSSCRFTPSDLDSLLKKSDKETEEQAEDFGEKSTEIKERNDSASNDNQSSRRYAEPAANQEPERRPQPKLIYGSFAIDGKLDGTYPFAMDITIDGHSVTGTYYSEAARVKAAGTISGNFYDNELNIYVTTGNMLSRTFEGTLDGNQYTGTFISGYDGAHRSFKATVRQ